MNDLTDLGPREHEYGSLSNEYFDIGCKVDGNTDPEPVEVRFPNETKDKYGRPIKYARCEFMDDDCYWYVDQ